MSLDCTYRWFWASYAIASSLTISALGNDETGVEKANPVQEVAEATPSHSGAPVEEVVVEGEIIEPMKMQMSDFKRIYSDRESGTYYFNIGDYERAFPPLLVAAKNGLKDAQAKVGFIILHGLGGVQKSNIRAVGWLGVAAEGRTKPYYREYFKNVWSEIPAEQLPLMSDVVQKYRETYGSDERLVSCSYRRPANSHIADLYCHFDREYELLLPSDWESIMAAIGNGVGFSSSIVP